LGDVEKAMDLRKGKDLRSLTCAYRLGIVMLIVRRGKEKSDENLFSQL